MIEEVTVSERVSIFRYPTISVKCPSEWVDEAVRFDEWSLQDGMDYLRGWNAAKRLSKRAFAAYYGLQKQFMDNHHRWKKGRIYTDFCLSNGENEVDIIIQAIPIKDYKPKIGKSFTCNIWKSSAKRDNPLIHVFCAWWCPITFILGWIPDEDLKSGKSQIRDHNLKSIHSHPILSKMDNRGMYV